MQTDFSEQILILEEILNRDYLEAKELFRQYVIGDYREKKYNFNYSTNQLSSMVSDRLKSRVFVRKDSPSYLTKGEQQLVLRLNDRWVAKAANHFEWENFYGTQEVPHYTLQSKDTVEVLKNEFGFDIPMEILDFECEEDKIKLRIDEEGLGSFMIVPDLTEGGKYIVRDIEPEEDFTQFSNGDTFRKNLDKYLTRLVKVYGQYREGKVGGWNAQLHGHIEAKGTPEGAIRRMFFLKIDPNTQYGEIVPGDFNHVFFYRKERDEKC